MNLVVGLLCIIIVVLGFLLVYIFKKNNTQAFVLEIKELENRVNEANIKNALLEQTISNEKQRFDSLCLERDGLRKDLQELRAEKEAIAIENTKISIDYRELKTRYDSLIENQDKIKLEFENLQKTAKLEFEKVANEILKNNTESFKKSNEDNMSQLLKPLDESIKDFKEKIQTNLTEETKQRTSLEEQIKKVMEQASNVSKEANNLASALKSNNKKAGNWGENILETILETSGLEKDIHYETQKTYKDDENRSLRPDVIVYLPDNRAVIIDSKVSLVAYDEYFHSETEEEQNIKLHNHIESIRSHIINLESKKYSDLEQKALDFTMMFIPIEGAYLLAMQNDKDLWSFAYNKRIIIISGTTLISSLRIISDLWKKDKYNKNAIKIAESGEKMLAKLYLVLESIKDLGDKIKNTQKSYDEVINRVKDGRGNLIGQVKQLNELGIKVSGKKMPEIFDDYQEDEANSGDDNLIA
ncbi:MAG: hypothetical protein H6Q15_456 [Bacteroidetes bacterium]|nr:hypothetical protein [Bacteroidota bacterium]